jgi:DNA polymerase-3 subunit epsilon
MRGNNLYSLAMQEKIFFYDLETTGLNPRMHGIHQISGAIRIDGKVEEFFDFRMRPYEGCLVDPIALSHSGLTPKDIEVYEDPKTVFPRFLKLLKKYVDNFDKQDKFIMGGFNNAAFDNEFMREMFLRAGDKYFGSWFWADSLDCRVLAMQHLKRIRHRMPNFKQMTVARQLGITVDEALLHEAQYDVSIMMQIYDKVTRVDPMFD